mmetsp:Transcript_19727/g.50389  ORF Transcript_19727/g.50389 Transcript_19727/m.50389 type:complete len:206 (+) Transcript_19727:675-1292(+)
MPVSGFQSFAVLSFEHVRTAGFGTPRNSALLVTPSSNNVNAGSNHCSPKKSSGRIARAAFRIMVFAKSASKLPALSFTLCDGGPPRWLSTFTVTVMTSSLARRSASRSFCSLSLRALSSASNMASSIISFMRRFSASCLLSPAKRLGEEGASLRCLPAPRRPPAEPRQGSLSAAWWPGTTILRPNAPVAPRTVPVSGMSASKPSG